MINVIQRDPKVDQQIRALKCILSSVTKQVVDDIIANFFSEIDANIDEYEYKMRSGYDPGSLVVDILHHGGKELYDWMMNQKETSISKDIWYWKRKTMVFVSHGNTELDITFSVHCPLPEDDFKTLDMLGKVHREYKPGKMVTSIFCEI